MPNPRLAGRYAKSLIDLATERNQLEVVFADMQYLQALCKQSREFDTLLKSPIIKADKKQAIIDAVTAGKISELTAAFTRLLTAKGRESNLADISTAFIAQYREIKGIHEIFLTTATPVSEELKSAIVNKIKSETAMQQIELQTRVDESLIGGFVLEMGDKLVDASIARDLRDVRQQFLRNDYLFNIR